MLEKVSFLEKRRREESLPVYALLQDLLYYELKHGEHEFPQDHLANYFSHLKGSETVSFEKGSQLLSIDHPLKVGVVLSGGQAPGGHNVIAGLFDALKTFHVESELLGFLGGPSGIVNGDYIHIRKELIDKYRNQGGFDLIGSGRTKIGTKEQLNKVRAVATELNLDGLVVIGGDDSNTNAALLAEDFLAHGLHTSVVGVPKTIDGDLKTEAIEISF